MRTSGRDNDLAMALIPLGVLFIVAVWLLGGPKEFLQTMNWLVGATVEGAMQFVSSVLS